MSGFDKDKLRFVYYARDPMDVVGRFLAAAMLGFPIWSGSKVLYNSFAAGGLTAHQTFTNVVAAIVCLFGWGVISYIALIWFLTTLDRNRGTGRQVVFLGPIPIWRKSFTLDEAAFVSTESISRTEDSMTKLPMLTRSYSVYIRLGEKGLLLKGCSSSMESDSFAVSLREWANK